MINLNYIVKKSRDIILNYFEKQSPISLKVSLLYVRSLINQSKYTQAISIFEEMSQTVKFQVSNNLNHLSEKEKSDALELLNSYFRVFNSFVLSIHLQYPSLSSKIYNNILASKSLLFQSTKKMRTRVLNSDDKKLKSIFRDWQNKREFLAKAYNLSIEIRKKREIDLKQLEEELNSLEKVLSIETSKLESNTANLLNNKNIYTWLDVQKNLKKDEAAIEILRVQFIDKQPTDSIIYVALIIKPDTKNHPEMLVLSNGNEIEGQFFYYYKNAIKYQRNDQVSYQYYWKKIAEKLKGVQKVYFSPDGIYHQINLNTLKNPKTDKFLLEEIDIHIVGNTKYLLQDRPPLKQRNKNAVLIGRPAYNLEPELHLNLSKKFSSQNRGQTYESFSIMEELAEINFSDLPGTEKEVLQIQKNLDQKGWNTDVYLGKDALEEVIKQSNSPSILHIATHGFFLEDLSSKQDTSYSVVESDDLEIDLSEILLENRGTYKQTPQNHTTNPMLRSGIVLAGVSTFAKSKEKYQAEDGILTAFEAMNLNLDDTELLVLSACETGKGSIQNGEGVFGLQRGFQTSGVRSIIMSLWDVSDQATQELMTEFYKIWLQGNDKRSAFKKAQSKLKKKYKHPYFWGAFIMIGE